MLLNDHSHRLPGPDIIRAIAIVLVVLSHTSGMWRTGNVPVTADYFMHMLWPAAAGTASHNATILLPKGRTWVPAVLGVELFFVLSGYLIGTLLIKDIATNGQFSFAQLKQFVVRRWLRTLPAYWVMVTLLIPVWLFVYKKQLTWKVMLYYVFLQNMVTPHPGFYTVAWSLSVEEWFYITLPVFIWIVSRNKRHFTKPSWLLCCLLVFFVATFCLRVVNSFLLPYGTDFDNGIRKMVITRLDAPLYGVLIAWGIYYKPHIQRYKQQLFAIAVAGTIILAVLMYYLEPGGAHIHHWLYIPFNTVLVYTLLPLVMALYLPTAVAYRSNQSGLVLKVCTFIARISYSAYLTHQYIFFIFPFSRVHFTSLPVQLLFYGLYMLVVCLFSQLLHYTVEQPMLRVRDRLYPTVSNSTHTVTV